MTRLVLLWSVLVYTIINVESTIIQEAPIQEILLSLNTGEIDVDDVNEVFQDLGVEVNLPDADVVMLEYSHELPDESLHHRSKRHVVETPLHFMDIHMKSIEEIGSTANIQDVVYSRSFNLARGTTDFSLILLDNVFYHIKDGVMIALTCASCTLAYDDPDAKVVRTVVTAGVNSAFVVQVTLREKTDVQYETSYFTAWKVSLDQSSADDTQLVLTTEHLQDFQVVKNPRMITPENSYSRVSMLELTADRFLTASFHKIGDTDTVDGPHLTLLNAERDEFPILNEMFSEEVPREDLKDIQLLKVSGEERLMLLAITAENIYIFDIEEIDGSFSLSLLQKCAMADAVDIVYNSDSVGTFLTVIKSSGEAETMVYDHGNFVQIRKFVFEIVPNTWRSIETRQELDLPVQDMVVFKDTSGGIQFVRHVMPGMYEALKAPIGLSDYLTNKPTHEVIDIGRRLIDQSSLTYEYFLLMLVDGSQIDYIKVNLDPIPYTIDHLNDVSICLSDLENQLLLDDRLHDDIAAIIPNLIDLNTATQAITGVNLVVDELVLNGDATFGQVTITIHSETGITYDAIDYTIPTSSLSTNYQLVNEEDTSENHLFANLVFANGPFNPEATFSITTGVATLTNATFTTVSTTELGDHETDDLVHHILSLVGDQSVECNFEFNGNLKVTGQTTLTPSAMFDGPVISPADFIDLSKSNEIELAITVSEVVLATGSSHVLESTINSLQLNNFIPRSEMNAATTAETAISIAGVKTITEDITAATAEFGFIGEHSYEWLSAWYDSIIWTNKETQQLDVNSFTFTNIIAKEGLLVTQLNGLDVSQSQLEDLFRDNSPSATVTISGDVQFTNGVNIVDLEAPLLNSVNPEHYLMQGIDQTIDATVSLNTLIIDSLEGDLVNGWDLTTAVRIDTPQVINTHLEFTQDIVVKTAVEVADTITIADIDFSAVGRIQHVYDDVIVTSSVAFSDEDVVVEQITFNDVTVTRFNTAGLQDEYLMQDIPQTLPELIAIHQDVGVNDFVFDSTLDGVDVSNVMKTSGDQDISATNIQLTGTTKFYENIIINNFSPTDTEPNTAAINDILIVDLRDDIACDKSDNSNPIHAASVLHIDDTAGVMVKSYFDLTVNEMLKVKNGADTYKEFGAFNTEVASLHKTNTFNNKVTFTGLVEVDGSISSNVDIAGTSSALLNGNNLVEFSNSIVKNNADFSVTTPVTVRSIGGIGQLPLGSTFDSTRLDSQYDNYIVLDKQSSQTITSKLTGPNFAFADLSIVPEAGDNTFFNERNFNDYTDTLLTTTNVVGSKTLLGNLNVGNNIIVNTGSNPNHLFNVDVNTLLTTSLFAAKDQIITAAVTADDITAKSVETYEANGAELNTWCFKDEACVINRNAAVEFSAVSVAFPTGLDVYGDVNGKSSVTREALLLERSVDSITNLKTNNKLVFTNSLESDSDSLSYLLNSAVRKTPADQVITAATTFNEAVNVINNFDIDSGIINVGKENEVNFNTITSDAAFLNEANIFTAQDITIDGNIHVDVSLIVAALANTATVNTVVLTEYLDEILLRSTDPDLVQVMSGDLTLQNGLEVQSTANIIQLLDGVQVTDYVLKAGDPERVIPGITLNSASTITGDIVSDTAAFKTDLDNFFNTVVYANSDTAQVLPNFVDFNDNVVFTSLTADFLNNIPTDTFILRNSDVVQTINQDITLPQETVTIAGNLETNTINGIDLTQTEVDILLINREETIAVPELVTFSNDVTLTNNEITIEGFPTIISDFITLLENFSRSLLTYYMQYIAEPLRPTVEEIYVANRIGSKRAQYLDVVNYDAEWFVNDTSYTILGIDATQHDKEKFTVKLKRGLTGGDCDLGAGCTCQQTRIASQYGIDSIDYNYTDTVFTFTLPRISLTAVSEFDGTSASCNDGGGSGDLRIDAVELDAVGLQVQMKGVTAESLGSVFSPVALTGVYQILDMDLFQLGDRHLLAVTTGYAPAATPSLRVYDIVNGGITEIMKVDTINPILALKTITFKKQDGDDNLQVGHIFITVDDLGESQAGVKVFEWTYTEGTGAFSSGVELQTIPAPYVSAMEVFKCKPTSMSQETIQLAVAYEFETNLVRSAILDILEYSMVDQAYVYSSVAFKHRLLVDTPISKVQAKKFTDYTTLAISTANKIAIHNFIPNVGVELISEYVVRDELIDWTWFQDSLPKTKSSENLSTIIFIIKKQDGVRSSESLRIGTHGMLYLPELQYKPDDLGF